MLQRSGQFPSEATIDPRRQTILDLQQFILSRKNEGHDMVLLIDSNEPTTRDHTMLEEPTVSLDSPHPAPPTTDAYTHFLMALLTPWYKPAASRIHCDISTTKDLLPPPITGAQSASIIFLSAAGSANVHFVPVFSPSTPFSLEITDLFSSISTRQPFFRI